MWTASGSQFRDFRSGPFHIQQGLLLRCTAPPTQPMELKMNRILVLAAALLSLTAVSAFAHSGSGAATTALSTQSASAATIAGKSDEVKSRLDQRGRPRHWLAGVIIHESDDHSG